MKILFLHSGNVVTGSVTYARALEQAWRGHHQVYWANDGFSLPEQQSIQSGLSQPLFPNSLWQMTRIARYVKAQKIQMLHAHSRRANLVAAGVSQLTGVPYVVTAHMRTKPRPANRILPCWGHRTIAICENVETHLRDEHHLLPERIRLIRNGIDLDYFHLGAVAAFKDTGRWITLFGRLSGKRWHAVQRLLSLIPDITCNFPDARFRLIGWVEPQYQAELQKNLLQINAGEQLPRIVLTDHIDDPRPLLAGSTLVIAAGRSLMETLAMEVPAMAMGEQASYGLLTPSNYKEAQKTNFGDIARAGEEGFDTVRIEEGIRSVLRGSINISDLKRWGREQMVSDYALPKIAQQVDDVYTSVLKNR